MPTPAANPVPTPILIDENRSLKSKRNNPFFKNIIVYIASLDPMEIVVKNTVE
ncbi:hypothetical protein ACPWR0_18940 [Pandoraea pneumonica]|uniref:hypothetical protein n=1 Tax=Pandoraea pneumonica TaxID=2508299 RepID=UPI003CF2B087